MVIPKIKSVIVVLSVFLTFGLRSQSLDSTSRSEAFKSYERPYYNSHSNKPPSRSKLLLPPPRTLHFNLDQSAYFMKIGDSIQGFEYAPARRISYEEFKEAEFKRLEREYWAAINLQKEQEEGQMTEKTDVIPLLPPIPLGKLSGIFGGKFFNIKANMSGNFTFGMRSSRFENPRIPINQRRQITIEPDIQFKAGVEGKIGKRLNLAFGIDSKPYNILTQNQIELDYQMPEHTIIQEIKLFNTDFNPKNSLIAGTQNILGAKVRLRFGNLKVDVVGGLKQGATNVAQFKNGANVQNIDIRADQYLYNRYFFLGHFFRNNYESSLQNLPVINSNVQITRLEVYITNRSNETQDLRNIACFLDLGEAEPHNPTVIVNPDPANKNANDNNRNDLFFQLKNINRDVQQVGNALENIAFVEGTDFEILGAARKLKPNEYFFNEQLGFIGLRQPINDDQVIAVAFEYTFNGQRFQVGELIENYQNVDDNEVIFLKMIRPASIQTDLPSWDLMMKNIYNLGLTQVNKESFKLQVIYKDDLTGQDRPIITEGKNVAEKPLIQLLNADQLNTFSDPQPDGNFDFIENVTIEEQYGILIFPALEPFGSSLSKFFTADEQSLVNKYVFDELYEQTQVDAQLNTTKNKFRLMGEVQGASSNVLRINSHSLAEGSVKVRVGNTLLTENIDYTVNYPARSVTINNSTYLQGDQVISVEYEQADIFSVRNRIFAGIEATYDLTKDISFTGTFVHLSERPNTNTSRVNIGNEPLKNTVLGLKGRYASESLLLTKLTDKLPFVSTKAISKFSMEAEAAQLFPGLGNLGGKSKGVSYIDDFERSEKTILLSSPLEWQHGATPQRFLNRISTLDHNSLPSNYKRAKLSWYIIDASFYNTASGAIVDEQTTNFYERQIFIQDVFPNRVLTANTIVPRLQTFDLAYYPIERGVYNYTPDLTPQATLPNPETNFGAITMGITGDNVDFDKQNIQYIEFWLLDPFLRGENALVDGQTNTTGGSLYFNLGNISEDFIPDGQHFFENGLNGEVIPTDSKWGRAPIQTFITQGFGTQPRNLQDLGFDGLNNAEERQFFQPALDRLNPQARALIDSDPSADDFIHFNDPRVSNLERVAQRYKNFNGVENNSPAGNATLSSTNLPDDEDLNNDNTINLHENYFEYRLDLKPGLKVGDPYIVDKIESRVDDELMTWYQVRIPIRDPKRLNVNNIKGFKNMRFLRAYLTGWKQPVILRMLNFQITGTFWRPYEDNLIEPGLSLFSDDFAETEFNIATVNLEENSGAGVMPYNLPPGFVRDPDLGVISGNNTSLRNEQSLQLDLKKLGHKDARAAFRNFGLDLINYGRLRLEIHAHSADAQNRDFVAFIRIGTDPDENYYEIAVPLVLTPFNTTFEERERLWPAENSINIALDDLYKAKSIRDKQKFSNQLPFSVQAGKHTVTVKGHPDLGNTQVILVGVRNEARDLQKHDITVWFNELRVADFSTKGGRAVNASTTVQLADFANVNANLRYTGKNYGDIQSRPNSRSRSDNLTYEVKGTVNLHKLGLERAGISLPVYASYSETIITPFFDPQDRDVPLQVALESLSEDERSNYKQNAVSRAVKRTLSIPNLSKTKKEDAKAHFWDIENLSLNASYSDETRSDTLVQSYFRQNIKGGATYKFAFKPLIIRPFKKITGKKLLKPLGNLNFSLLPKSILISGVLNRNYEETYYRGNSLSEESFLPPLFRKQFTFDRSYQLGWDFTRNLKLNYNAKLNSIIDEPFGALDTEAKKDTVLQNLRNLGRPKNFTQDAKITYNLPLKSFPLLDFISRSTINYNFNYAWQAARLGQEQIFANTIANKRTVNGNLGLNLGTIYAKWKWLNSNITGNLFLNPKQPNYALSPVGRKVAKLTDLSESLVKKAQALRKILQEVEAKFKTKLDALKTGPDWQENYEKTNAEYRVEREKVTSKIQKLTQKQLEVNEAIKEGNSQLAQMRKDKVKPPNQTLLKLFLRTLTGLKTINLRYSRQEGTTLPGYVPIPKFLGFDESWEAPGLGFVLGDQSRDILLKARQNNWLVKNEQQINPFKQNQKESFKGEVKIDILNNLSIRVHVEKTRSVTFNEVFRYNSASDNFVSQSPFRSGSYKVSYGLYQHFFNPKSGADLFRNFIENLPIVRQRLIDAHPAGVEYDTLSQDVMVPTFIATYTQKDARSIPLTNFPRLPLPNWSVQYPGIGKIPAVKKILKQVNLSHAYKSFYEIGRYSTSLVYMAEAINLGISEQNFSAPILDDSTGQVLPLAILSAVIINEQFAPLIGVDIVTLSDLKLSFKYGKGRTLTFNLNNTQITEVKNEDYSFGLAFSKQKLLLPFKMRGRKRVIPNQLTFTFNITLRDTETIQRLQQGNLFISNTTNGSSNFQLRGTLNYQFIPMTQRGFSLDGGVFFERSANRPKVQNISFPRFNTYAGIQLKVNFAQ